MQPDPLPETNRSSAGTLWTSAAALLCEPRWLATSAALLLGLAALAAVHFNVWKRTQEMRQALLCCDKTKAQPGPGIGQGLAELKLVLYRYQLSGTEPDRQRFQAESRRLAGVVSASVENACQETGSELARQLNGVLERLLEEASASAPVKAIRRGTAEAVGDQLDRQFAELARLADALAEHESEHEAVSQERLEQAYGGLKRALRWFAFGGGALLLALFPLAVLAVVEPMRARLTRSQLATERHEKLASLGVLAAGVAHEIRNPLTAIKCRLFSLKKDLGPAVGGSEDFATINREMDRLERIVRAFLDFARPPEPRIAALPAQAALDHVRKVLSPEFVKRNVSLELEVDDKLTVAADRQQLEQVLINLAQNAADSMPGGGKVLLRARGGVAEMGRQQRRAVVMLDVIDHGQGISPETQRRLFDPFFTTKEGGTGLGLAIASRIIERNGGLLQFSTRQHSGTTFTIVLPQASLQAEHESPHSAN